MSGRLSEKRVALVVTEGVQRAQLVQPRQALLAAGAAVDVLSASGERVTSWTEGHWGEAFSVDARMDAVDAAAYDALLLPCGVSSEQSGATPLEVVRFVQKFAAAGKAVGTVCHAARALLDAGVLHGRRVTAHPSLADAIRKAGGDWVDEPVVVDRNLITSRGPEDLGVFCSSLVFTISRLARSTAA